MAGFDDGFVLVGKSAGVGEAGGVLEGEAAFVEGVGGEVARGGETLLFVFRGFLGVVDSYLKLAAEAGGVFRKGEAGAAAGTGGEAFEFGESGGLLLRQFADAADGGALVGAAFFDAGDLGLEAGGEGDVGFRGVGVFLYEAIGDRRAEGRIAVRTTGRELFCGKRFLFPRGRRL